jgi:hypothetical protein
MKQSLNTVKIILIALFLSSCGNSAIGKAQVSQRDVQHENSKPTSELIKIAYSVVVNESQKLPAACNIYVLRVLELMGFPTKPGFVANNFDVYAKKSFKNYRAVFFNDIANLKRHLWSYPERTGFILQWKRSKAAGHVAIVERVDDKLYIYQASLNKYHARINETTLENLLLVNEKKGLTVFSELQ